MNRFILQRSKADTKKWIATDTRNKVCISFIEHRFNDTQEVVFLEDNGLTALECARIMREIGDWMVKHHSKIAL